MSDEKPVIDAGRLARIRLLSTELDEQRKLATDREKTQGDKASFVLVVAGLVVGLTYSTLATSSLWALALLPVVSALATAVCATFVLWPRDLTVTDTDKLLKKWVITTESPDALEAYLLETKLKEIAARDARHNKASGVLRASFRLLLASIFLVIVVAVINGLVPGRKDSKVSDEQPVETTTSAWARPNVDDTMQVIQHSGDKTGEPVEIRIVER